MRAHISLTRKLEDRLSCGCISSGFSVIRRYTSLCCLLLRSRTKLFRSFRGKRFSDIRRWWRPRLGLASSVLGVWAHHMFTVGLGRGREHLLHAGHDGDCGSDGDQDLQLARDIVGRQDSLHRRHDVCHRFSVSVSDCRADGHHACRSHRSTGSWATRTSWWRISTMCLVGAHFVHAVLSFLLLVSEDDRPHAERKVREVAVLAIPDRLSISRLTSCIFRDFWACRAEFTPMRRIAAG